MGQTGPGQSHREGISVAKLIKMFPDDDAARDWIAEQVWPDGPRCPHCGSANVQFPIKHNTMTHRCRDCPNRPQFSLKTGTVMQGTKLGYQTWAIAIYLVTTNLKGVSSMKLHRDLDITQKSAWHLAHRLRKAFEAGESLCSEPEMEVDETYIGGKRRNMSNAKRKALREAEVGRGGVGKSIVVGAKDRKTKKVAAQTIETTDRETLHGFIDDHAAPGTIVFTDDASGYKGMPFEHHAVNHSTGEYVRDMAHTNGIESFWSMLKRGYIGTYHKMSPKHLDRYVREFTGRNNIRDMDTVDQMAFLARSFVGKRLKYRDLV